MRILYISDQIRPVGGTERCVARLCSALVAAGHNVCVVHRDTEATATNPAAHQLDTRVERLFLPALFEPNPLPRRDRVDALATIAAWQPDIVHVHHMHSFATLFALQRMYPVVLTHHTVSMICPSGQKLKYRGDRICTQPFGPACLVSAMVEDCGRTNDGERMRARYVTRRLAEVTALSTLNRHIAMNIVHSSYMVQELMRAGYPREKISLLPIGLDIPDLDLSTMPRTRGVPHILVAGRLVRQKGVHLLLRALRHVERPYHLFIAGDGPMGTSLQAMVRQWDLTNHVTLLGWIDGQTMLRDLAPDLVVMPSLWPETFGLAGTEALAHGIPVVAFAGGAIPEWLVDGQTGWLAETAGNVMSLTDALDRALRVTDAERRRMGAQGRALIAACYSLPLALSATVNCYDMALEHWSGRT